MKYQVFYRTALPMALAVLAGSPVSAADAPRQGASLELDMIVVTPGEETGWLYNALGGQAGINIIVDKFFEGVMVDTRMRDVLANVHMDVAQQKQLFKKLFAASAAGKKKAAMALHEELSRTLGEQMTTSQFNAGVENLYEAMEAANIHYYVQNNVMHVLAPLKNELVR